jgi:transposase
MYRRMRGRNGHNQAIFAVAHQILRIAYTMLRRGEDYRELGSDYYDRRNKPKVVPRLVERLTRLGYQVWLEEAQEPIAEAVPAPPASSGGDAPSETAAVLPERKRGRPCKCVARAIICPHQRNKLGVPKTQTTDISPT